MSKYSQTFLLNWWRSFCLTCFLSKCRSYSTSKIKREKLRKANQISQKRCHQGDLYFDFLKWLFLVHLLFVENQLVDGQTSRKIVIFGFNVLFTTYNLNITTNFSKNCLQGVWICVILRNNFLSILRMPGSLRRQYQFISVTEEPTFSYNSSINFWRVSYKNW